MKHVRQCLPARLEVIKSVQPGQISLISQLAASPNADLAAAFIDPALNRNPAAPSCRPFNRPPRKANGPFRTLSNLVANLFNQMPGMRPTRLANELTAAGAKANLDSCRLKFLQKAAWLVKPPRI